MAEYTLTIKDEDGGISILLAGKGQANTAAALAANALLGLAPRLVQDAVRAAASTATVLAPTAQPGAQHRTTRTKPIPNPPCTEQGAPP
ncbi:hypothetical protein P4233_31170 [Pseudomonas aeruginosa]|nr:hypothetical protein [Pseudomonas aeruginosa]